MRRQSIWKVFETLIVLVIGCGIPAIAQNNAAVFPMVKGEAVATCYSGSNPNGHIVGVYDLRDPQANGAVLDTNWDAPVFDNGQAWTSNAFCAISDDCQGSPTPDTRVEVFGIALDDDANPNIYLTSTSSYVDDCRGNAGCFGNVRGSGEVFKINGTTGAIELFATLDNFGQGLGNIAYDGTHQQFFVTNFYDGKIYRLDAAGNELTPSFDPFSAFDENTQPQTDFIPPDERPWGVAVHEGRLYFGLWASRETASYRVYSAAISPSTGAIDQASVQGEISDSSLTPQPVSDIAFSSDGELMVAERTMIRDGEPGAHGSNIYEFWLDSGQWNKADHFDISAFTDREGEQIDSAAGGVTYICLPSTSEEFVVASGDALHFASGDFIYGLQMTPATGGNHENSYLIDLDGEIQSGGGDKTDIGDVEAFSQCESPCMEIVDETVICEEDGSFTVQFRFRNLRPEAIEHMFALQAPEGVSIRPSYFNLSSSPVTTDTVWPPLSEDPLTVTVDGASPGEVLSFLLTIHDAAIQECCSFDFTIPLPSCDCAQVLSESLACKNFTFPWQTSTVGYTFELENLSGQDVEHLLLVPSRPKNFQIQPNYVPTDLENFESTGPIPITLSGPGSVAEEVCFLASLHDASFNECCAVEQCVRPQYCFNPPPDNPIDPIDSDITYFGREIHVEPKETTMGTDSINRYGFELGLGGGFGCLVDWQNLDIRDQLVVDANMTFEAIGAVGSVGEVRVTVTDEGDYAVTADFSAVGATNVRAEVYNNGRLTATLMGDDMVLRQARWPESAGVALRDEKGSIIVGQREGVRITLPNGDSVVGDSTVFSPWEPTVAPGALESLRVLASAEVPRIVVTDLGVTFDCNENGVPDVTDIASGTSADVNGNGQPDECEPAFATP